MEVGAVKQAFNNEVILLKKKLNQAKIQIIHKLTRKAKTLAEKKAPDHLKEKNKRKAESAVQEVLVIKKIKAMDLAKFIITHTGELTSFLNKPKVDNEKACARLLLHKVLQEKYQFISNRFRDVPIKDLFMSRQERLKLKKEAREKQKNKKKGKSKESEWKVENVVEKDNSKDVSDVDESNEELDKDYHSGNDPESGDDNDVSDVIESDNDVNDVSDSDNDLIEGKKDDDSEHDENQSDSGPDVEESDTEESAKVVKLVPKCKTITEPSVPNNKSVIVAVRKLIPEKTALKVPEEKFKTEVRKPEKKLKDNKNKNMKEKILKRKFKKDVEESPVSQTKIVDPFFITESGENYMSVAEPRPPDEVKEVHKEGNRKLRRAVMFGHVKPKPRNNYGQDNSNQNRFGKQNVDENNRFNDKPFKRGNYNDRSKPDRGGFNDKDKYNERGGCNDRHKKFDSNDGKPEKLHPSWEAKKKQSGILPFQGKKIVFSES